MSFSANLTRAIVLLALSMMALAPASAGHAQAASITEFVVGNDEYEARRWTTDDGLPSNLVYRVVQAPEGYIWVVTSGGLVRFDGVHFTKVSLGSTEEGFEWLTTSLTIDPEGTLWCVRVHPSTMRSELVRRVGGEWEVFVLEGLEGLDLGAVEVGPDGSMFLIAADPDTQERTWAVVRDGQTHRLEIDDVTMTRRIATRSGDFWAGTPSGGILRVRGDELTRFLVEGPATPFVNAIAEDHEGGIWTSIDGDLYRLEDSAFEHYPGPGLSVVDSILATREGHLWISNRNGPFQRITPHEANGASPDAAPGTIEVATVPVSAGVVSSALEDTEGGLWFTTNNTGLLYLRPKVLPVAGVGEEPINMMMVQEISPRTTDSAWLVHECVPWVIRPDGTRFDPFGGEDDTIVARQFAVVEPGCVRSVAEGPEGGLWLLHGNEGLARLRDGVRTEFPYPYEDRDTSDWVGSLLAGSTKLITDSNGELWYARNAQGVVRVSRDGEQLLYPFPRDDDDFRIRTFGAGANGDLWFGTNDGFGRFAAGRYEYWRSSEWFSGGDISDIYVDAEELVWVASQDAGLLLVDGSTLYRMRARDGLPDDRVFRVVETDGGDLWLLSGVGIVVVSRAELRDFLRRQADLPDFGIIGPRDGGREARNPNAAAMTGLDGRMWIFGRGGTTVVDPENMRWDDEPPIVVLEAVLGDGAELPGGPSASAPSREASLTVPAGVQSLSLRYTVASFNDPGRVRFRCRLEGQDADWVEAGDVRTASYSNLWPGDYTFRVAARKNFGSWGETSVRLRVRPLWWQTRSFLVAAILSTLGLGAAIQSLRTRAVRRRNLELEREVQARRTAEVEVRALSRRMVTAQEEDRARVARDLHDDISQRLYLAAIKMDPPIAALDSGQGSMVTDLREIQDQLEAVAHDTRKISHELHPSVLEVLGLKAALEGLVDDLESINDARVATAIPESLDAAVSNDAKLALYRIAQEGLRNVDKHAAASRIEVDVAVHDDRIRMRIKDDGRGFETASAEVGLGLASMQERVRLLNGTLRVESSPGAGTELVVELPIDEPISATFR